MDNRRVITIEIDEIPPSLNQMVGLATRHRMLYANEKKRWKEMMHALSCSYPKIPTKSDIYVELTFPTRAKHDRDNYYASFKFILDGLAFLEDDNSDYVEPHLLPFKYEKGVRKTVIRVVY